MAEQLTTVLSEQSFLECPRWHEDRIWVSDFYTHRVLSAAADGSDQRTELELTDQPSGLGWLPDGRLLVTSMLERKILRREDDGSLIDHADLSSMTTTPLNDMIVDATGRAYVGSFGFDLMGGAPVETSPLFRVEPDGVADIVAEDLYFPNGSVITDDSVLLVDESFGNRVSAFTIAADGSLSPRRDWARFGSAPTDSDLATVTADAVVAPDGCALDAQGGLWIADAIGQRALRVVEGGEITAEIKPGLGVYACALGGPDGHTLFLCCAPDFDATNRSAAREASLLATRVDVPAAL